MQKYSKEHHSIFTRLNNDYVLVKSQNNALFTAPFHEVCERVRGQVSPHDGEESTQLGWVCKITFTQEKDDSLSKVSYTLCAKSREECEAVLHQVLTGLRTIATPDSAPLGMNQSGPLGSPVGSSRLYRSVALLTKFTLGLTALTLASCALILVLPLGAQRQEEAKLIISQKVDSLSAAANNHSLQASNSPKPVASSTSKIKTDGYISEKQLHNLKVLAGYAGISFLSDKMPENPAAFQIADTSFFLFSSLTCADCGSIENMVRSLNQTDRGYVMPVGIENEQTVIGLSHTYCGANPYTVWEQLRLHRPDVMDIKACEGWDERAKAASFAELMITGTVKGEVTQLNKPVLIASNGAYHIGGFSDDTTSNDLLLWLKQNSKKAS